MAAGDKNKAGEAGFGSRFISGLKDLLIEEELPNQTGIDKSAANPANSAQSASKNQISGEPIAFTSAQTTQSLSSPMATSLLEQILSRATAYTALNDAIKPLEEIIPDEMTRYRAAFAVIKKNRSIEQVVQAIDMQHMQALDDEVTRFAAQAKQKEATDINVRIAEAQTLRDNVEAAGLQIVKLREETESRINTVEAAMQRDRGRLDEIDRELLEKRQAIALIENQFNSAVTAVKDNLMLTKSKILKYLTT
jgi:hypothetical protein